MREFIKSLNHDQYKQLLYKLGSVSSEFGLVVRNSIDLSNDAKHLIKKLALNGLADFGQRSEWPGTKLMGHTAQVFTFNTCSPALNELISSSLGLYDWLQPERPEDLFFRSKNQLYFANISHENWAAVELGDYLGELRQMFELENIIGKLEIKTHFLIFI